MDESSWIIDRSPKFFEKYMRDIFNLRQPVNINFWCESSVIIHQTEIMISSIDFAVTQLYFECPLKK